MNAVSASYRGKVGMWCLITAESAIFSIFVVAYLYYVGKSKRTHSGSSAGRTVFTSICLFSSSLTILIAKSVAQRQAKFGLFMLVLDDCPGRDLSDRHRPRVVWPDLSRRLDHQFQPVRHDVLLVGRPACLPRNRRRHRSHDHPDPDLVRSREAGALSERKRLRYVLALCGRDLGGGFVGGLLHRALRMTLHG